jgi:hypothetical protein
MDWRKFKDTPILGNGLFKVLAGICRPDRGVEFFVVNFGGVGFIFLISVVDRSVSEIGYVFEKKVEKREEKSERRKTV